MKGFHKINGANWLTDSSGGYVVETKNAVIYVGGKLPENWDLVKELLLGKDNK